MKRFFWACVLGIGAMQSAHAADFDACVAPTERLNGHVVRVEVNGVLVLDDGRAAVLEGIQFPRGAADHAPDALAHQAVAALSNLARDHDVTMGLRPPEEDRYARLRAQVLANGGKEPWLQIAMLRQGLARVAPMPARGECTDLFYAAEREARGAKRGLWAMAAYAIRSPDRIPPADTDIFQIVEGRVQNADVKAGRAYLNFGTDGKTDFTVTISPDDMPAFRAANVDPRSYAGKTIRVRGMVDQMNGPEIEIGSPQAIEILP